jgi:hypothetical protein
MTGRCFAANVIERYLYGRLPLWQVRYAGAWDGGEALSDWTTKRGGNSIGTAQLGGPGFTSLVHVEEWSTTSVASHSAVHVSATRVEHGGIME